MTPSRRHARRGPPGDGVPWPGIAAALLLAIVPFPASAQSLDAKFVERESGQPVEGALVRLLTADGEELASSLTSPEGRARLTADSAGRVRVSVERIGFERWRSPVFRLRSGETASRVFRLRSVPVELGGVSVEVDEGRCRTDPATGRATARLWEEIRKALERERRTRSSGEVYFRTRTYRRVLDGELRLLSEDAETGITGAQTPYRSVPADVLRDEGFVARDGSDLLYRAPDPDVLLSDPFQRTHCFGIRRDSSSGRVGLTFRPVEGRSVPDVEGVLWVDAETAALQQVDYHYRDVGLPVADSLARGRVAFEARPGGEWIVRRWWIRWPMQVREGEFRIASISNTGERVRRRRREVVRYEQVGGRVTSLLRRQGDVTEAVDPVGRGSVVGTAWDSLAGGPASDVQVRLRGTQRVTTTDSLGDFAFRGVPEGRYSVIASPPALSFLPDSVMAAPVEVVPDARSRVTVAVPGPERVRRWACGEDPDGLVMGRLVEEDEGSAMVGAPVRFRWRGGQRLDQLGAAGEQARRQVAVVADSTGRFVACQVPLDRRLTLEAPGVTRTLQLTADRPVATLELAADPDARLAGEAEGSLETSDLAGEVRAKGTGNPLEGARVELIRAGRTVLTDGGGGFLAEGLEPGSHRLVVQHLGYATDTVEVALEEGVTRSVVLSVAERPVRVADLEVEVERDVRDPRIRRFYRRADEGLGRFVTADEVSRQGVRGSIQRLPNVQVRPCYKEGESGRIVIPGCHELVKAARGSTISPTQSCSPVIYIDGVRIGQSMMETDPALQSVLSLPPSMIEGIELHDPATVPARYGGVGSNCGVMLVWTKR